MGGAFVLFSPFLTSRRMSDEKKKSQYNKNRTYKQIKEINSNNKLKEDFQSVNSENDQKLRG